MAVAATSGCSWPIGFGFRPTEEELITHYLINKILGHEPLVKYIHEIDLYNYDPWQLPAKSFFESDNYEWFFFRVHTSKTKRSTPAGCWKTTGDDRPIKARGTNKVIATRKILVFYRGRGANVVKTNWVIHEYHLVRPAAAAAAAANTNNYHYQVAAANTNNYHYQPPFVVCRLKENAEEERYVPICDQDEHNNTTLASHLKKKGKRNRDDQASGQSVLHPQPPALADFQSVNALNMQPIHPRASENEDNLTQILNSIPLPDEYSDDATSKMCRPPWSSIGNDGEVNNQSLQAQAFESVHNLHELFFNSIFSDDEDCGEVTSNNRVDGYNKEEWDSMILELQHGGFNTDTDTDSPFVLPNNHISSSCFHEYRSSAVQNMSTIKKLHRSPLAVKRLQYKEEQYVLQGGSTVLSCEGEGEGEARACGILMGSDNSDSGSRTFKAHCKPKSSNTVSHESEPKRNRLKREIRSEAMSQYKAGEDEKHIEIVDSPQLSMIDYNNGLKSEAGNKSTESGMSCCGSIASTNNRFSNILTTKCIHHNSSLPLVYAAKAFLGILMFVMFAQEVLLYGHRR